MPASVSQPLHNVMPHVLCKLFSELLSEEECAYIESHRGQQPAASAPSHPTGGFSSAASDFPPSYRTNERYIATDESLARWLLRKTQECVPTTLWCPRSAEVSLPRGTQVFPQLVSAATKSCGGESQVTGSDHRQASEEILSSENSPLASESASRILREAETWDLVGINERLRWCRYLTGQEFLIHQDGVHHRSVDERSWLTFMIYLTDPDGEFQGGETHFFDGPPNDQNPPKIVASVRPKRGSLIIFDHVVWHSGAIVVGEKRVVRSDLVYKRRVPLATVLTQLRDRDALAITNKGHVGYIWCALPLPRTQSISSEGAAEGTAVNRVATGGRDTNIVIWSLKRRHISDQPTRSQGGESCAANGWRWVPSNVMAGHRQSVLALTYLVVHGRIASVSRDRTLRVWNVPHEDQRDDSSQAICLLDSAVVSTATLLCIASPPSKSCAAFRTRGGDGGGGDTTITMPAEDIIAVGDANGHLSVWALSSRSGRLECVADVADAHADGATWIWGLQYTSERTNKLVSCSESARIGIWDPTTMVRERLILHNAPLRCLTVIEPKISSRGAWTLLSGDVKGQVVSWNSNDTAESAVIVGCPHETAIRNIRIVDDSSLSLSVDDVMLLTSSEDQTVKQCRLTRISSATWRCEVLQSFAMSNFATSAFALAQDDSQGKSFISGCGYADSLDILGEVVM